MKINILLPSFPIEMTGGYKIMLEYANELTRKGDDVMIYFVMKIPYSHVKHSDMYFWLKSCWFRWRKPSWFKLDEKIRVKSVYSAKDSSIRDAEILFFTECQLALAIENLSKSKGIKINLIQDYENWILPNEDLLKESYKKADVNVVISDYLNSLVESATNVRPFVCYNAYHPETYHVRTPIEDRKNVVVAMLYHKDVRKGCKYGLEALRLCKKSIPDLRAKLFGLYLPEEKLEDWIEFQYNPQDLCGLYNEAAIFVTPSLQEGWGLTATEAMACGCALVATDVDGLRVFAKDNDTALLVPPKDAQALADRILELIADNRKRINLAQRGNKYIKHFTWAKAVEQLRSIFLNTLEKG